MALEQQVPWDILWSAYTPVGRFPPLPQLEVAMQERGLHNLLLFPILVGLFFLYCTGAIFLNGIILFFYGQLKLQSILWSLMTTFYVFPYPRVFGPSTHGRSLHIRKEHLMMLTFRWFSQYTCTCFLPLFHLNSGSDPGIWKSDNPMLNLGYCWVDPLCKWLPEK